MGEEEEGERNSLLLLQEADEKGDNGLPSTGEEKEGPRYF